MMVHLPFRLSALASLWVVWSLCQSAAAADWPQWRGAGRDGHVTTLPKTMPEMKPLWEQRVAGPCDAGIGVAGGLLVMADHDDTQDYYRCYAAADGKALWQRSFPNDREMDHGSGPRATPLFHKDKVYVLSAFGELYCFDLKTGNTVWQKIPHQGVPSQASTKLGLLRLAPRGRWQADRQPWRQGGSCGDENQRRAMSSGRGKAASPTTPASLQAVLAVWSRSSATTPRRWEAGNWRPANVFGPWTWKPATAILCPRLWP